MQNTKAYDDFETWLNKNWDELSMLAAESGADQAPGFDWDGFVGDCYDDYVREAA